MICITTQGSAFERGQQHGAQTAALVHQVLARYNSSTNMRQLDPAPILREIEARFPEVISEMEGIAAGSGISKDEIFRLNLMGLGAAPACSTAGVRDVDGKIWIAKTDDIGEMELGWNILRRDIPTTGDASLHLHFAGSIWTSTVYSANGFCMAMTGLTGEMETTHGLPPQVLWRVLSDHCKSAWEAVALLESCPLSTSGMSLLLADANQTLLLVEKTSAGQCVRELTDEIDALCHTNHTCMGKLQDPPHFANTRIGKISRDRLNRLHELVAREKHTLAGMQALLKDHSNPGGICQHGGGGLHTDYGVILSPSAGGIWLTKGAPCKVPFEFVPITN